MQKESKTNNNQVKKTEKTENEQHVPHIKPRKTKMFQQHAWIRRVTKGYGQSPVNVAMKLK